MSSRKFNGKYQGKYLNYTAFPLGGIGAGMICIEGTGDISHFSIRNKPEIYNEPIMFSAICVKGDSNISRVIAGPVPRRKIFFPWSQKDWNGAGKGGPDKIYGLPRCADVDFSARFPFGLINFNDPKLPLNIKLTAWSPFIPGDSDNSSLPVAELEYRFTNISNQPVDAVYSFHSNNAVSTEAPGDAVKAIDGGFILYQPGSKEKPWDEASFSAVTDDPDTKINYKWFRGGWFDDLSMVWKSIEEGTTPSSAPVEDGRSSTGGSLYIPFSLKAKEEKVIKIRLAWYVPESDIRIGLDHKNNNSECCSFACSDNKNIHKETYSPWYSGRFKNIEDLNTYWQKNATMLYDKSKTFSDCFYNTSLPDEIIEAVSANLSILKSPTVLRQTDGKLWGWEGCHDSSGCCSGSCTHVWNYAQAIPHLFPDLERTLRETEFSISQNKDGHQTFRAALPIREPDHEHQSAADGQLGGIMKVYREWQISGDTDWLHNLWPLVRKSLEYSIKTWDPNHEGVLSEPHHNTYDIEFWGPDGMCTSFYLGALKATVIMGKIFNKDVSLFEELLKKGLNYMENKLFNGEYFYQKIKWEDLKTPSPLEEVKNHKNSNISSEEIELLKQEGPKYQYGSGCLSDGVLGAWIASVCGIESFLPKDKLERHLLSVYKYNFQKDLSEHANPQRPTFAMGKEGGLLLCSWPRGNKPSLPFVYSEEVWTGFEYQVASHLMMVGHIDEGLKIVQTARKRYDGQVRNPFNEYECGHWYARAMSSYGLIQGITGVRYSAVDKTLIIKPRIDGDFHSFLSTATGFGTVGIKEGEPFINVKYGVIEINQIEYTQHKKEQE